MRNGAYGAGIPNGKKGGCKTNDNVANSIDAENIFVDNIDFDCKLSNNKIKHK